MPKIVDEVFHTTSTAARELRLSEETVRNLCDRGILRSVRDGVNRRLITSEAIRDFLEEKQRQVPTTK